MDISPTCRGSTTAFLDRGHIREVSTVERPSKNISRWRRSSHSRASAHGAAHSGAPPSATSSPNLTDEHQADAQQHADDPVAQVDQFLDEALEKPRERLSGTYRPTGLDRFPESHLFYKSYILEQRCLVLIELSKNKQIIISPSSAALGCLPSFFKSWVYRSSRKKKTHTQQCVLAHSS